MEKRDKLPDEFDGRGPGGYYVFMDARLTKLEVIAEKTSERLGAIETDLAVIKANCASFATSFATRIDLKAEISALEARMYQAIDRQTWKLVSFVCGFNIALITATVFIVKNVL